MNYLQVEFTIANAVENEILIALLANAGFESFEETDNTLKAFIKEKGFTENSLEEILQIVPVQYKINIVPQQNWNAKWESSFEPIRVNDIVHGTPWVAIRAGFHQPIHDVQHEIIITPKMSFGTGHHATTYMMIAQMQALDFTGKMVVDFGTGTAVLAILAEKMGAAKIDAIDHDEWSIENSIENAASNLCNKINIIKADTIPAGPVYDIILANINLNIITLQLGAVKGVSKKGTHILLSGFIKADEPAISIALLDCGITVVHATSKGEWLCLLAVMN